MCRDRVQPGADRATGLELVPFQVKLEEGILEHVVRQAGVAEIAAQVPVKLPLVAMDQSGECWLLTPLRPGEEFLVGTGGQGVGVPHGAPIYDYVGWDQRVHVSPC